MFSPQVCRERPVTLEPADTTMSTQLFLFSVLCFYQKNALGRPSVTVTPSRSQYFEYEQVSVSCEQFGPSEWTVWRYIIKGLELSQCGSGWGNQTSSTCDMKTVKVATSGVYWCESEYGDSSNVVNITVTNGGVILHSPVLPVTEGDNVTLDCKTHSDTDSSSSASFYKNDFRTEATGHMTIWHFSKFDEGAYKCSINGQESPPSWLLMKDDSDPVSLAPFPDSSQRFEYENLSLSCGTGSNNRGWRVKRSTSSGRKMSSCGEAWGTRTEFGCVLDTAKNPDSGTYWCESPAKQRSNSVNITIYGSPVILQIPALAVMEARPVTLQCREKNSTEQLPADFYKDGSLIRTEPTGHMTIQHVTKSDEGLYKCHISSRGESPSSRLLVRADQSASAATDSSARTLTTFRHIAVCSPYFICTLLMLSIYRQRHTVRTVSITTPPPDDDGEEVEPQYEDVIANVTTEHHF